MGAIKDPYFKGKKNKKKNVGVIMGHKPNGSYFPWQGRTEEFGVKMSFT